MALLPAAFRKRFRKRGFVLLALFGLPLILWGFQGLGFGWGGPPDLPETVGFNEHIRPILSDKCFACHGPDAAAREADLRLDTRQGATAERDDYDNPAVVPGEPGESALIQRIYHDDPEKVMPPPEANEAGSGGKELTEREKALFEKWIEQGATWEKHWSYSRVERPDVPAVEKKQYVQNPLDHFIVARLEQKEKRPSELADRRTLIRRLSLDLTGLPPTPEEVEAFVHDERPDAYERLVDRLLASPHFGERMALLWLDLVRYAETDGYHSDLHRHIFPFRDYVIASFNENKPFDQFTREQIAGDLLPDPTREQLVATGFNRLNQATKEGGSQPEEYLTDYAVDRVRTVSNTWLASTVECAQCHDHKYDPFTQKDFFSMAAFFADVKERGLFRNENELPPEMALPSKAQAAELRQIGRKVEQLERQRSPSSAQVARAQLEAARKQRDEIESKVQKTLVTKSTQPRVVRVLGRGDWQDDDGEVVQPGVPEFLPKMEVEGRRADRLDLANWLVSRDNPLTARAFVNQLWDEFFGTGLSKNLGDFGAQGEWPTHPRLVDWLAAEFMESGWNVKHTIKLIVTSHTYRQTSKATDEQLAWDPQNRFLARQSRFRLKAEVIRDNALAISGLLNEKIGGPSVKPYQPEGYWRDIQTFGVKGPAAEWTPSKGEAQYRRGLYTYWKRSFLHPSMKAFDAPSRQLCIADRVETNTPLQALVLMNDPTFVEAARVFAHRAMQQGDAFEERLDWAFRRALAREAEAGEVAELSSLYEKQLARYEQDAEAAKKLINTGQYPVPEDVDAVKLAAWTAVTRTILNLHETITRY